MVWVRILLMLQTLNNLYSQISVLMYYIRCQCLTWQSKKENMIGDVGHLCDRKETS